MSNQNRQSSALNVAEHNISPPATNTGTLSTPSTLRRLDALRQKKEFNGTDISTAEKKFNEQREKPRCVSPLVLPFRPPQLQTKHSFILQP
jgi:hypothetical protein